MERGTEVKDKTRYQTKQNKECQFETGEKNREEAARRRSGRITE